MCVRGKFCTVDAQRVKEVKKAMKKEVQVAEESDGRGVYAIGIL